LRLNVVNVLPVENRDFSRPQARKQADRNKGRHYTSRGFRGLQEPRSLLYG